MIGRMLLAMSILATVALAAEPIALKAEIATDELRISAGDKLVLAYKTGKTQKYPWFYPVNAPGSGQSVTTESSEPYPHHHSLFFGCDKVNGHDYWQGTIEDGQIISQGPKLVESAGARIVFEDTSLWQTPGAEADMRDMRRVTVSAPTDTLRYIDFEITLEPLKDVTIEKSNHSLFAARVVTELCVESGGTLVNAEGKEKEAGTYSVASPWCSYSGVRDGVREGIAIFQHPKNRWYPAQWFTRDYGFFSPTPMYWLECDKLELKKGESFTLRYRVIVYSGEPNVAALFDEYAKTVTP